MILNLSFLLNPVPKNRFQLFRRTSSKITEVYLAMRMGGPFAAFFSDKIVHTSKTRRFIVEGTDVEKLTAQPVGHGFKA